MSWISEHRPAPRWRLPVRYSTAAIFALIIAYRGGLWLNTIQSTSRTIERNQPPQLVHWLRDSTLMLPLVFVAVVLALLGARWWIEHSRREYASRRAAVLLIFAVACAASAAEVATTPLHDYLFQPQRLGLAHAHGTTTQPNQAAAQGFGAAAPLPYYLYCKVRGALISGSNNSAVGSTVTQSEFAAIIARLRSLYDDALGLAANLVICAVVLVFMKDKLWSLPLRPRRRAVELSSRQLCEEVVI